MVAIIFFPSGRTHLANHLTPYPVRICPLLPDPSPPLPLPPPNVRTFFMDGPLTKSKKADFFFL